ncbi:MAG TPA: hypothetical protein VG013_39935 [Gemmataceae bacterium]|jgi:hypothetical protein|nr:hypothetical protein [Gemmataceae bacterium]
MGFSDLFLDVGIDARGRLRPLPDAVFAYVIRGLVGAVRQPAAVAADEQSRANGVAAPAVPASTNGVQGT